MFILAQAKGDSSEEEDREGTSEKPEGSKHKF
jgi:hypothetical protein